MVVNFFNCRRKAYQAPAILNSQELKSNFNSKMLYPVYVVCFQESHKAAMNNVEHSSKQSLDELEHKHQVRNISQSKEICSVLCCFYGGSISHNEDIMHSFQKFIVVSIPTTLPL